MPRTWNPITWLSRNASRDPETGCIRRKVGPGKYQYSQPDGTWGDKPPKREANTDGNDADGE